MDAFIYAIFSCHYWQEAACGHRNRRACLALWLCMAGYALFAVTKQLG